ncbi:MAG: hypothetical protein KDK70_40370 [Myxococcales bacterium]|nr:hypothetical protein [Myxococcales bacterium]
MSEKRRQDTPCIDDAFVARVRACRPQAEAWWRDIEPQRLMRLVRAVLEAHEDPRDGGSSSSAERVVLDVQAWLAWVEAGLGLFGMRSGDGTWTGPVRPASARGGPALPPLQSAVRTAQGVALVLAMLRHHGNLSHAAQALWVSRRTLRGHLRDAGLYPWPTEPTAPEALVLGRARDEGGDHDGIG